MEGQTETEARSPTECPDEKVNREVEFCQLRDEPGEEQVC